MVIFVDLQCPAMDLSQGGCFAESIRISLSSGYVLYIVTSLFDPSRVMTVPYRTLPPNVLPQLECSRLELLYMLVLVFDSLPIHHAVDITLANELVPVEIVCFFVFFNESVFDDTIFA